MWTVNFEFYRSTYGGEMEAESFPQAMRAACAYIDTLMFGRLRGAEEIGRRGLAGEGEMLF